MERETIMGVDVDGAWERFKQRVQNEPVPVVWTQDLTRQSQSTVPSDMISPSVPEYRGIEALNDIVINSGEMSAKATRARGNSDRSVRSVRLRNRVWRNTAGVAAVIAIVGGSLSTPWGQKVAAEAMQTFYVQHLTPINRNDLQTLQNALGYGGGGNKNFNLQQYGNVKVDSPQSNVSQPMTLAQIEQATGYSIPTLPGTSGVSGATGGSSGHAANPGVSYSYSPAETVTLQLHVNAINQLIQQLGGTATFPSSADNVPIVLTLPSQVTEYSSIGSNNQYENLMMLRIPSVQVPGDVDLNQVRQAMVSLPFMPSDIVSALNAQDWNSTLYVPQTGNGHMATVNGQNVIVSSSGNQTSAMWITNGYFYDLSGSSSQFPTEASILETVKEISG